MKKTITDARLQAASRKVLDAMSRAALAPGEEHVFSPEFESAMDALVSRTRGRERALSLCRRIAAVLAAALIGAAAFVAANPDARAAVAKWFLEVTDQGAVYHFSEGDDPLPGALPMYEPEWLPADMVEMPGYLDSRNSWTPYRSLRGEDDLSFIYYYLSDRTLTIPRDAEPVSLQGQDADFYQKTDAPGSTSVVIWVDEQASIVFIVTGSFEKDVMIAIAESVRKVSPET